MVLIALLAMAFACVVNVARTRSEAVRAIRADRSTHKPYE
jgi:hypothetical protein